MKKVLLMAFAAAAFTSCSDDDNATPPANSMTLQKTETYYPDKAEYDSGVSIGNARKDVTYYENNRVVADSTFDMTGTLIGHVEYAYTSNTATLTTYSENNTWYSTYTYTYDTQGRVSHYVSESKAYQYTEDGDLIANGGGAYTYAPGTITFTTAPGADYVSPGYQITYHTNSFGVITDLENANGNIISANINGDKLLGLSYASTGVSGWDITYNYYSTTVPANFVKSVTQLNNLILVPDLYVMNDIATKGNYYLESTNVVQYTKEFNAQSYITYDKAETLIAQEQGPTYYDESAYESFYYYN